MPTVCIRDCRKADQFVKLLSPHGPLRIGEERQQLMQGYNIWLYRGVADDEEHKLIPSTFRFGQSSYSVQLRKEKESLFRFFELCDATGLQLPEDSQELRTIIKDELSTERNDWPPKKLWSLLALAQHYEVATRLLDWSRKPYIAAYFAASGALSRIKGLSLGTIPRRRLTVWILDYSALLRRFDAGWAAMLGESAPPGLPVELITAPHAQNPHLHAQDGVFTLQLIQQELNSTLDTNAIVLDRMLCIFLEEHKVKIDNLFRRIRLPWGEAKYLLWLLEKEGVTAATIFP
jgi:hypothetical protein